MDFKTSLRRFQEGVKNFSRVFLGRVSWKFQENVQKYFHDEWHSLQLPEQGLNFFLKTSNNILILHYFFIPIFNFHPGSEFGYGNLFNQTRTTS